MDALRNFSAWMNRCGSECVRFFQTVAPSLEGSGNLITDFQSAPEANVPRARLILRPSPAPKAHPELSRAAAVRLAPQCGETPEPSVPMTLTQMILSSQVDIAGEIEKFLRQGQTRITIGLGAVCNIPLFNAGQDFFARERVLLTLEWDAKNPNKGYQIKREVESVGYGIFFAKRIYPDDWVNFPDAILFPGDFVSLGSVPAEGKRFVLPLLPGFTRAEMRPRPDGLTPVERAQLKLNRRLQTALRHWRDETVTFGTEEGNLIRVEITEGMPPFNAVIRRDLRHPESSYQITALDPFQEWQYREGGSETFRTATAKTVKLNGLNPQIKIGGYTITLPTPGAPQARFNGRLKPTFQEILDVLELEEADFADPEKVKKKFPRVEPTLPSGHQFRKRRRGQSVYGGFGVLQGVLRKHYEKRGVPFLSSAFR